MEKITAEQIKKWKQQHGTVFRLKSGDAICYIKKPSRQVIGNAMPLAANDPMGYCTSIIENCWLGGDVRFKEEDDYFMGVFEQLKELTASKVVEVEKC